MSASLCNVQSIVLDVKTPESSSVYYRDELINDGDTIYEITSYFELNKKPEIDNKFGFYVSTSNEGYVDIYLKGHITFPRPVSYRLLKTPDTFYKNNYIIHWEDQEILTTLEQWSELFYGEDAVIVRYRFKKK